jgi:hypothetical protein
MKNKSEISKEYFNSKIKDFLKGVKSRCGIDLNVTSEEIVNYMYACYEMESQVYGDDFYFFPIDKYFDKIVISHKIEVFVAGCKMLNIIEKWGRVFRVNRDEFISQLLLHDLSKFSVSELGYAFYNFKDKDKNSTTTKIDFELAWNHHKHNNKHHPEHWLSVSRKGELDNVFDMPYCYILEMVADWIGASAVYGNPIKEWIEKNIYTFKFSEKTTDKLKIVLTALDLL